ncbi:MAG: hypothetical protein KC419_10335 [Anaerolineales bacterium]|nr:hypothetical protein [Anaerolineales bacterium]
MFEPDALLLGGMIGLASAVIGAIIDYRILQRRRAQETEESSGPPGCIFIVSGTLGLLGLCVIAVSLVVQSLGRALVAGLGVMLGFFGGFLLMLLLWMLLQRGKSE